MLERHGKLLGSIYTGNKLCRVDFLTISLKLLSWRTNPLTPLRLLMINSVELDYAIKHMSEASMRTYYSYKICFNIIFISIPKPQNNYFSTGFL
jgi:hypothetical protein